LSFDNRIDIISKVEFMHSSLTVTINGKSVPVDTRNTKFRTEVPVAPQDEELIDLGAVVESLVFKQWVERMDPSFVFVSIEIGDAVIIKDRVGMIYLHATYIDGKGREVVWATHLRGDSVAVFIDVTCEGCSYIVMATQVRYSDGTAVSVELPAGMLDGDGNLAGVMFKEILEEIPALGPYFKLMHLDQLGPPGIRISPGGCDERMSFFQLSVELSREALALVDGSTGGAKDENEEIKVRLVPRETLASCTDAKVHAARSFVQDRENERMNREYERMHEEVVALRRSLRRLQQSTEREHGP
jgi:ADP-sugar diphosphatase